MGATSIGRRCREQMIQELRGKLEESPTVLITSFGAVTMHQLEDLRRQLRKAQASCLVVKQSLARRALQALDLPNAAEACTETMAFVFAGGDPSTVSKVAIDFAKAVPTFRVSAGLVERRLLPLGSVTALASLPPKPVLLAKLCGGMQAPHRRLVGVLRGTVHRVTLVLQAIRDRQGTSSSSS